MGLLDKAKQASQPSQTSNTTSQSAPQTVEPKEIKPKDAKVDVSTSADTPETPKNEQVTSTPQQTSKPEQHSEQAPEQKLEQKPDLSVKATETKPATSNNSNHSDVQHDLRHVAAKGFSATAVIPGQEKLKKQVIDLVQGQNLETIADRIIDLAKSGTTVQQIGSQLQLGKDLEPLLDLLVSEGVIVLQYPLNVFSSPKVLYVPKNDDTKQHNTQFDDKTILEEYTVKADNVIADIQLWSTVAENTAIYQVIPHKLGDGTEALVEACVKRLADKIPVSSQDITNPRRIVELRTEFYHTSLRLVEQLLPQISKQHQEFIAGVLVHRTYGLGDLEVIMADDWLEEIAINGAQEPISVYHKRYGWLKTTTWMNKKDEIYNFATQISRKVGKQINALNPIMDAHLQTGDRVAATLFPVSTEGDTMTIRRFSRNPWTITHMIDPKVNTLSAEILALLWESVQYELNFMVVGGTASGKTSALSTLSSLIPPTNRIISIEDTREITLPEALHWNWVPMSSKSANNEGQGEVTMLDLMVASLRMRPDRIIVGEIRRKQQAEAMFEAMHTGHSVCATMHADTAEQIKRRLTQPPIDIPENEIQALQLVLVQYRDRRRGLRRTLEVAELLPGANEERINLNYLYRWRPRADEFFKDNESIRIIEDLNLHTGMTQNELEEDLEEKKEILHWLLKNSVKDVDAIGTIMSIYYKDPQIILDFARDGGSAKELLQQT